MYIDVFAVSVDVLFLLLSIKFKTDFKKLRKFKQLENYNSRSLNFVEMRGYNPLNLEMVTN